MSNEIHKERLLSLLQKDGDITYLATPKVLQLLRKLMFTNKLTWDKISSLPEYVYTEFNNRMREDCMVKEEHIRAPESGPHIIFTQNRKVMIQIDNDKIPRGILQYRRFLAVVAYYVGLHGRAIKPTVEGSEIRFTEEDWILISMATRYCLMPPKLLRKIYTLTKLQTENGAIGDGRPLLHSFTENLVSQTEVPKWVVTTRLYEHAFADSEFSEIISRKTIEQMMEDYRKNEHYKGELV